MNKLKSKHLLGIKDLSIEEIELIFDTAKIANIFFENSTRTKLSFELAEKRLSADIINFSSSLSSIIKGESLLDTINNILVMKVDMIVMRHPSAGAPHFISDKINASIINAGDGTHEHPTQALLDSFSIKEKLGSLKGKKIAIIGDILHSRVAISNIYSLQKLGAEVMLCGPKTLMPKFISEFGVIIENDIKKALKWCDVANVLRIQLERQEIKYFPSLREYSLYFGINKKLLDKINKDVIIMHPGPINRGIEISSDVADSKNSIILNQVENGVAIRMAVMYLLSLNNNQ
jgi:aspartate carbamoyltransferase catalytic subunit